MEYYFLWGKVDYFVQNVQDVIFDYFLDNLCLVDFKNNIKIFVYVFLVYVFMV